MNIANLVRPTFILNGRTITVPREVVTYEEIVSLAGLTGQPTVVYHRVSGEKPEGILSWGQKITIAVGARRLTSVDVGHTGCA
jgi:hypothetical protein